MSGLPDERHGRRTKEGGIQEFINPLIATTERGAGETGAADAPSPAESLRLVQAFLSVRDPAERLRIIEHVEAIADRARSAPR